MLWALYTKKEKDVIYTNKLSSVIETLTNNAFVILAIFKNNAINIQPNTTIHITKILVFKNHVLSIKKYYLSIY